MMRGAGGVNERRRRALPPISGYDDLPSFNAFHCDMGCILQGHHRSELYNAPSRRALRGFIADFSRLVDPLDAPATHAMLQLIADDVDMQEDFEEEAAAAEAEAEYPPHMRMTAETESPRARAPFSLHPAAMFNAVAGRRGAAGANTHHHAGGAAAAAAAGGGKKMMRGDDRLQQAARARAGKQQHQIVPGGAAAAGGTYGLDDVLFPMSPEIRLTLHQSAGMIHFITVIVSVYKSHSWGVSPTKVAHYQALSFCYAVFFVAANFSPALCAVVIRCFQRGNGNHRGRMHRYFFEHFVVFVIMVQNFWISTLFSSPELHAKNTKWIVGIAMHSTVLVFLGLFRAENASMKQPVRWDLPVQGAIQVIIGTGIHQYVHGHTRHMRMGDVMENAPLFLFNTFLWYWFVPVAFGFKVRSVYRRQVRVMEQLRLERKQKKWS